MPEFPWLQEYSGESTQQLLALEGAYRTDSIVAAFEQALDRKAFRLGGYGKLTYEERTVLSIEALEREVNNGGYSQFFFNTERDVVKEVATALEKIGRGDLADLTTRAIKGKSDDDELERCDSRYFEMAGDLSSALLQFIKNAQSKITLP